MDGGNVLCQAGGAECMGTEEVKGLTKGLQADRAEIIANINPPTSTPPVTLVIPVPTLPLPILPTTSHLPSQ